MPVQMGSYIHPSGRAQGFTQVQIKCWLAKWFSKVDPVSGTPAIWRCCLGDESQLPDIAGKTSFTTT